MPKAAECSFISNKCKNRLITSNNLYKKKINNNKENLVTSALGLVKKGIEKCTNKISNNNKI